MDFCRFTTDRVLVEGLFWKDVEILVNQYGKLKNTRKVNKVKFQDDENRYDPIHHSHQICENKPSLSMTVCLWASDPWRWYALNELQIHGVNMYFPFLFALQTMNLALHCGVWL
ncbi:hypothetical protein LXL04_031522 [Taraxacum kok-saghyz]